MAGQQPGSAVTKLINDLVILLQRYTETPTIQSEIQECFAKVTGLVQAHWALIGGVEEHAEQMEPHANLKLRDEFSTENAEPQALTVENCARVLNWCTVLLRVLEAGLP